MVNSLGTEINYNHDGSKLYYASINSSGAHPPLPPLGKRKAFTLVVSPGGGGALENFITARGLGISILRSKPQVFDTHVFERWMIESIGKDEAFVKVRNSKNLSMFLHLQVCFLNFSWIFLHYNCTCM